MYNWGCVPSETSRPGSAPSGALEDGQRYAHPCAELSRTLKGSGHEADARFTLQCPCCSWRHGFFFPFPFTNTHLLVKCLHGNSPPSGWIETNGNSQGHRRTWKGCVVSGNLSLPSLGPPLGATRKHTHVQGRPGWLSWLRVVLCPERLPIPFLVQVHTWIVGLVPAQDASSLSLSLSSYL